MIDEVEKIKENLRLYLCRALKKSGLTQAEVNRKIGTQMAGHYFGKFEWEFPKREIYEKMQEFLPLHRKFEDITELNLIKTTGEPGKTPGTSKNLHRAIVKRNDEFYTQFSDIENELKHYKEKFAGKVIYCNCDNPFKSNFVKYLILHFNEFKIKKLIASCYGGAVWQPELFDFDDVKNDPDKKAYKFTVEKVNGNSFDFDIIENVLKEPCNSLTELKGNGDFRSAECVEILKSCDIVVTNPPFSLFIDFVDYLIRYKKDFIVIGTKTACGYKNVFEYFKADKIHVGVKKIGSKFDFIVPDDAEDFDAIKEIKTFNGKAKKKLKSVPALWFTSFEIKMRHLDFTQKFAPEKYPAYDNYKAIECSWCKNVLGDYSGVIGVPITFFDWYNSEQFELLCMNGDLFLNGENVFKRILIKRRMVGGGIDLFAENGQRDFV